MEARNHQKFCLRTKQANLKLTKAIWNETTHQQNNNFSNDKIQRQQIELRNATNKTIYNVKYYNTLLDNVSLRQMNQLCAYFFFFFFFFFLITLACNINDNFVIVVYAKLLIYNSASL